ncbi:hypothetical protein ABPG75_009610 [Micractinium tetrahymenae]
MNGVSLKRKLPPATQTAAAAVETGSTEGPEAEQQLQQQACPQQQSANPGEQRKRQKQFASPREGVEQHAGFPMPKQPGVQQDSEPARPVQPLPDGSSKPPDRRPQQHPESGAGQIRDRQEAALRGPAHNTPMPPSQARQHLLPAVQQQRWPLPPPPQQALAQQQQAWRPIQQRPQPRQPVLQGPASPWQPAPQPWQVPSMPGWQPLQQAQLGTAWDASLAHTSAWDPGLQQWPVGPALQSQHWPMAAAPLAAPLPGEAAETAGAWQQAQGPAPPALAAVQPAAAPLLQQQLVQQQALVLQQQQQLVQQQALVQQQQQQQQHQQQQVQQQHGQQPRSKLERDVPPGGEAEALLRLAVRICCERLGSGEHDGRQLGKVLEELDRNWRQARCSGHSVSVLLRELDRRGLVVAREETSGGKRVCIFRNLAC